MKTGSQRQLDQAPSEEFVELSKLGKFLWNTAGTFFLVVGLIGIILPLLPTTPFLLLALACYFRGSEKMYQWMLSNRIFGEYLKNYREGRGIPIKIKLGTISLLWLLIVFSAFIFLDNLIIQIILIAIGVGVTIHLLLIKTEIK